MSTRCTTHFKMGNGEAEAIIYRHSDGYPDGAGKDLLRFLKECSKLEDSRLSDPSYLAAKYVVFLADKFNSRYGRYEWNSQTRTGKYVRSKSKLDFLSVGVCRTDPYDIEYRYTVDCAKLSYPEGLPEVKCYSINESKYVQIPKEID